MEDKTGSAFCVRKDDITKYEWMAKLRPFNTVFQAELLATHEACLWASTTNQQEILLKSANIKLGWIRAHVGYSGNEAEDVLAKRATQDGIPIHIPEYQESIIHRIKSVLQNESIILWQKEWDNGETGRSVYNVLLLLHGKGPK
ncbi:hypothetical protein AVEN_169952-1 [Araneus ventricosus]|uniref:Uncharacterized protein n=1 Tax=Araneus ventricosus TaxID=182803 RepID=A0A4Y2JDP8_ARAVE|nr:hypothetical protein AVEN_169952-1 [Araneus ventricosus]